MHGYKIINQYKGNAIKLLSSDEIEKRCLLHILVRIIVKSKHFERQPKCFCGERGCSSHTKWLVAEVKRNVRPGVQRGAAMKSKHFERQPKCFCGGIEHLSNGTYEYQYYIKDHLGNVRVVFKSGPTLISEHHYYPFGERGCSSHTKWLVAEVKRSYRPESRCNIGRGAISRVKTLCATAKVLLREITNTYDASGRKWQSTVGGVTTTYFGDIEYEGNAIKMIYHEDGERGCSSHTKWLVAEVKRNVRPAVQRGAAMKSKHYERQPKCFCGERLSNGTYEYQYYIKDHTPRRTGLGNVRVVFRSGPTLI
jgi:hypothetical protein